MYKILDKIKSPADLKPLTANQLNTLCGEIREFLVETVSENGGHLAGNLGVVELTVALHRALDCPKDKIVWDVGHQSYVHKILTGRRDKMNSIRTRGGLCGFCNPEESEYDTVYTGHASTSLSSAMGIVQAQKITGESFNVACVIGDGSFTGGLAYEAMNNIGMAQSKMLIVLNDNKMSISENVGAFSSLLARARTSPGYTASKRKISDVVRKMPVGGEAAYHLLRGIKRRVKSFVTPNMLFEQLGITYLGPVNGHNIEDMEALFRRALCLNEPVLVHVVTKKGKGYAPAEKNPSTYHGVGKFNAADGRIKKCGETFSSVFGKSMVSIAKKNKDLTVVTPAMITGSGLKKFSELFPSRLYDVGIAEGHAVTFAAGLAAGGATAVAAIYSTFLQRGFDNIIHDAALGRKHIVLAVDRAGLVPGDGATHQGLFDISYLTQIPNMTLLSPSSFSELQKMLEFAVNKFNAPIAVRYPRGGEEFAIENGDFELSKAAVVENGSDVTIAAEGRCVSRALKAAEILKAHKISPEVIDVRTIKPMDFETIFLSAERTGKIYTLEENVLRGGMGEMIAGEAARRGLKLKIRMRAVDDCFVTHACMDDIEQMYGYTPIQIANDIERMIKADEGKA